MAQEQRAILTCPRCGHKQPGTIPATGCLPFYVCEGCGNLLQAKSCCVFCDYADRPCPVGQAREE